MNPADIVPRLLLWSLVAKARARGPNLSGIISVAHSAHRLGLTSGLTSEAWLKGRCVRVAWLPAHCSTRPELSGATHELLRCWLPSHCSLYA